MENNQFGDKSTSDSEASYDSDHDCSNTVKKTHLNEQAQQICLNVYKNLLKTSTEANRKKVLMQAASLTEVPYSTLCRLVKTGVRKRKRRSDAGKCKELDASITKLLKSTVYDAYKKNEIPTIDVIYRKLQELDYNVPCRNTLANWLKQIGFKFKTIDKRAAIMESRRIVEWRHSYLEHIKKFRNENRSIYYLDETWYDTHDTAKKGWTDNSNKCQLSVPANKGTRLVILHCGSADGWVPHALKLCGRKMETCNVDYHQNMNSEIFEEWFNKTLIPNLKPNSVIILDNASYHSRQYVKIQCNKNAM